MFARWNKFASQMFTVLHISSSTLPLIWPVSALFILFSPTRRPMKDTFVWTFWRRTHFLTWSICSRGCFILCAARGLFQRSRRGCARARCPGATQTRERTAGSRFKSQEVASGGDQSGAGGAVIQRNESVRSCAFMCVAQAIVKSDTWPLISSRRLWKRVKCNMHTHTHTHAERTLLLCFFNISSCGIKTH